MDRLHWPPNSPSEEGHWEQFSEEISEGLRGNGSSRVTVSSGRLPQNLPKPPPGFVEGLHRRLLEKRTAWENGE